MQTDREMKEKDTHSFKDIRSTFSTGQAIKSTVHTYLVRRLFYIYRGLDSNYIRLIIRGVRYRGGHMNKALFNGILQSGFEGDY